MSQPFGEFSQEDLSPEDPNPSPGEPDLAYNVYKQMGFDNPNVTVQGSRSSVADLKPGDLVGWNGGQEADGRYVGNVAIYAGDREIIEMFYGQKRRRKIHDNENVFGMPVHLLDDFEG